MKEIRQEIINRVERLAADHSAIAVHLQELDKEWDVECTLVTNAASLTLAGLPLTFAGA